MMLPPGAVSSLYRQVPKQQKFSVAPEGLNLQIGFTCREAQGQLEGWNGHIAMGLLSCVTKQQPHAPLAPMPMRA